MRRVQTQLRGTRAGTDRIHDTLIPYHMHSTPNFARTDNEDVRGLHAFLRLMPHHIELAGVQALVNLLALALLVVPRTAFHFGFVHAA